MPIFMDEFNPPQIFYVMVHVRDFVVEVRWPVKKPAKGTKNLLSHEFA